MRNHPYRQADARAVALPDQTRDPEASIIYGMLLVLGIMRLAMTAALDEAFDAEATVAVALVVAGVLGFARGR